MSASFVNFEKEITRLKKEKKAMVLAHFYQDGAIQDVADFIGDSFQLAKKAQESSAEVIVLAGVVFMAESVKAMNPQKTVLVPDLGAGCSLVSGTPYDKYLKWRQENPEAVAVTYINSSLEVKSISDVIITSSNAEAIINSIPRERKILFGPDQHLGRFLQDKLQRPMHLWNGECEVHVLFSAKKLHEMISENPDALVVAHPECDKNVLAYAQVIGSTSKILQTVQERKDFKKFIVATETGIFHQMKKSRPDVQILQAPVVKENCNCNDCPYMKLNSLEKIYRCLVGSENEILIDEQVRVKALVPLARMMDAATGKQVQWPARFLRH